MPVQPSSEGLRISVLVVPGASRDAIVGPHGDALRVRVASPPEKGRANDALVRLLAERLGVRRADVEVVAGTTSRRKTVSVRGVDAETARRRLLGDSPRS